MRTAAILALIVTTAGCRTTTQNQVAYAVVATTLIATGIGVAADSGAILTEEDHPGDADTRNVISGYLCLHSGQCIAGLLLFFSGTTMVGAAEWVDFTGDGERQGGGADAYEFDVQVRALHEQPLPPAPDAGARRHVDEIREALWLGRCSLLRPRLRALWRYDKRYYHAVIATPIGELCGGQRARW